MLLLILIGFLAGVVTAISPCVLPVLPVLLAGGASGRKPLRIVAGLVVSFSFFTLFASWILSKLGLPQDLLRNLAIAALFLMAIVLLLPQAGQWVERSLSGFTRLRPANAGVSDPRGRGRADVLTEAAAQRSRAHRRPPRDRR